MKIFRLFAAGLLVSSGAGAERTFVPVVRPPGFVKNTPIALRAEPGMPAILGADGKFTPLGQYLHELARDAGNVEVHFQHLFSAESKNWRDVRSPLFTGTEPIIHGHRLPRLLRPFVQLIQGADEISPALKIDLLTPAWTARVEGMFRSMVNADGLLARGDQVCTMALSFHFLRSGWEMMGLDPSKIYPLPQAQALLRTLLTFTYINHAEDAWLPASADYLASCRKANAAAKYPADDILIRDGQVFFAGGLFIGWKSTRPSLHATWDALAIINTLFSYHPEPNPADPRSIFHLWHQLSEREQQPGRSTLRSLRRKLWLDYRDHRGPSYCVIVGGRPTEDIAAPSEAARLFDHAGYAEKDLAHWAYLSWAEMFGDPERNTTNGVQALLAIVDGRVLAELKTPTARQKRPGAPGRIDTGDSER